MINAIKENLLLADPQFQQKKFLLAISGGVDSIVLAELFCRLGLQAVWVHCNYKLRANDSELDEKLVRQLGAKKNIQVEVRQFDTTSLMKECGESIQMLARRLRYEYFEELRIKHRADYIVTAHHLGDNIETSLLNFSRGTGLRGLTGMKTLSGELLRPLLHFTKDQLYEFAMQEGLEWREDKSNQSNKYKRNLIRNSIVPAFKKINPSFEQVGKENLERLKGYWSLVEQQLESFKNNIIVDGDGFLIPSEIISESEGTRVLLYELLKTYGFNWSQIKYLLEESQVGKKLYAENWVLTKERAGWLLSSISTSSVESVELEIGKSASIGGLKLTLEPITKDLVDYSDQNSCYISKSSITSPLKIRKWLAGDYMHPFGMRGKKKVSDLLTDIKVKSTTRKDQLVVLNKEDIVWLVGLRSSERYKVEQAKDLLKLSVTFT